ncbi:hypothetical protein AKO1_011293, partial [Acrasis kona]
IKSHSTVIFEDTLQKNINTSQQSLNFSDAEFEDFDPDESQEIKPITPVHQPQPTVAPVVPQQSTNQHDIVSKQPFIDGLKQDVIQTQPVDSQATTSHNVKENILSDVDKSVLNDVQLKLLALSEKNLKMEKELLSYREECLKYKTEMNMMREEMNKKTQQEDKSSGPTTQPNYYGQPTNTLYRPVPLFPQFQHLNSKLGDEMLRMQLHTSTMNLDKISSKLCHYEAIKANSSFRYTTLQDTKAFIQKHRRKPMTLEEAEYIVEQR